LLKKQQEQTHFFNLEDERSESGARLIFKAHPDLANRGKLNAATTSFVAGYLCHLVTDEVWINDIYRPFFGSSSPLGGEPMANLFDRLLQFELDRREREDKAKMEEIQAQICDWEPSMDTDFLGNIDLRQWRDFLCTAATREPSLSFFSFFAQRFLVPRQKVDPKQLEEFLSSAPAKLEWAIKYVTPQRLTAFRENAISQSLSIAREYLGEDN